MNYSNLDIRIIHRIYETEVNLDENPGRSNNQVKCYSEFVERYPGIITLLYLSRLKQPKGNPMEDSRESGVDGERA